MHNTICRIIHRDQKYVWVGATKSFNRPNEVSFIVFFKDRSFMKYCRRLFERRRNAILLWPMRKYGNVIGSESITAEAMYGVSATTTTVKLRRDANSAGGGDRCRLYKATTSDVR
jgi:hypothetical protein